MPQVAARHNPKKYFFHEAFLQFPVPARGDLWKSQLSKVLSDLLRMERKQASSEPGDHAAGIRLRSFQNFTNFYSNPTAGFAPVLYSLHSCSTPQEVAFELQRSITQL